MNDEKVIAGTDFPEDWNDRYSLNVHWWDSNIILGPTEGSPGGSMDVWAKGKGFADAVANAIRYVEKLGHNVDQVTVNV